MNLLKILFEQWLVKYMSDKLINIANVWCDPNCAVLEKLEIGSTTTIYERYGSSGGSCSNKVSVDLSKIKEFAIIIVDMQDLPAVRNFINTAL